MLCVCFLGQLLPDRQRAVEEATATLRAAVALRPQDAQGYRDLAAQYTENQFHRTAAETLATAVQLAPTDAETLRLLGLSYLRSRQPEPAAAALRESIALRPSHGEAYFALAGALERMNGDVAEQETLLRSAVAASPQLQPAIIALSRLLTRSGRLAEAEELLRGLLPTTPHLATRLLFTNLILQSRNLEAAYAWRAAGPEPAGEREGGVESEWAERLAGATQADAGKKCIERRCIAGLSEALEGSQFGKQAAEPPRKSTAPVPAASLSLPTDPAAAQSEMERLIRAAEPVVLHSAARAWRPFNQWTLEHLSSTEVGGSDTVAVTVVPNREVFEVHDDRIMRPPKSTARLADLVRFLNRKIELQDRLTLYTRQASPTAVHAITGSRSMHRIGAPNVWMRKS
jgi:Tfp pilus assembly protein PilF